MHVEDESAAISQQGCLLNQLKTSPRKRSRQQCKFLSLNTTLEWSYEVKFAYRPSEDERCVWNEKVSFLCLVGLQQESCFINSAHEDEVRLSGCGSWITEKLGVLHSHNKTQMSTQGCHSLRVSKPFDNSQPMGALSLGYNVHNCACTCPRTGEIPATRQKR